VPETCSNPQKTCQVFESALKKNIGFGFIVSDTMTRVGYWPLYLRLFAPGPKPLDGNISLKFVLENRLEHESFQPLIDFLGFWIQKLWSENSKIII